MEGSREAKVLRALALTVARVVNADAAAVLVVERLGDKSSIAVYGSSYERDSNATSPGPATHPMTNVVRGMLSGDIVLTQDVTELYGYMPLWSDDQDLRGGAMLSVSVRSEGEAIGVLIARRRAPFDRPDFDQLRLLDDIAISAIENAFPAVKCDRCEQYVDEPLGLVALVNGEWIAGHNNCYRDHETNIIWLSLGDVRAQPIWHTRVATTDRLTPETLTSRAVTSWYRILGEILPYSALLFQEPGRPYPIEGFTVQ